VRERGAVLCCVFRGRNAEGSNFPYDEARGVILIGVPYADYSDPVVQAQINYYNRKQERLGERWYIMDAFRAANQALGRGIRHRDDRCTFILMDHRYGTYHMLISSWATQSGVSSIDEFMSRL
jgi:regulator of telomere elongation helicase 1